MCLLPILIMNGLVNFHIFFKYTNFLLENAEADTFFCFTSVMGEIMNNFIKTLDKADVGIMGTIQKLNKLLKQKDYELWANLEDKKLNPQFYSFRWLTLLLSQEFQLPEVLRIWDTLFADPKRFEFLIYLCCAMIIAVKTQLLSGDFADNLKLLQSYPTTDIIHLIKQAKLLRDGVKR